MDPYTIKIGGVIADPYRIAISYGLDSAIGEAAKKLLRCGRKHKDIKTDVQEAIKTLARWLVIQDDIEREAMIESMRYAPSVERVSTEFPIDKVKEAIAKGSSDERAGLVPVDDAYIVHPQPTYAGPTQEQIAERNRQVAHNAALGSVILCQGEPITKYEVGPEDLTLGVKTNMEKLLDERDGETSWP